MPTASRPAPGRRFAPAAPRRIPKPGISPDIVYYKYCGRDGCREITYRVSLRLDDAGNVADKEITKRRCFGHRQA